MSFVGIEYYYVDHGAGACLSGWYTYHGAGACLSGYYTYHGAGACLSQLAWWGPKD